MNKIIFGILMFSLFHTKPGFTQTQDSLLTGNDIISAINDDTRGGNIQIYQNPSLHVLLEKSKRISQRDGLHGYRIQIFSGSGQNARDKSFEIQTEFRKQFPNFDPDLIYNTYQAPFFKLRLGDFRSKNEAVAFLQRVKKVFPNSYIVKSKINFPKLETK